MSKSYAYVGPPAIKARSSEKPAGVLIESSSELTKWVREFNQEADPAGLFAATFIIDDCEQLLIADRHSEHVACAGGRNVLSAGEIFFAIHAASRWWHRASRRPPPRREP